MGPDEPAFHLLFPLRRHLGEAGPQNFPQAGRQEKLSKHRVRSCSKLFRINLFHSIHRNVADVPSFSLMFTRRALPGRSKAEALDNCLWHILEDEIEIHWANFKVPLVEVASHTTVSAAWSISQSRVLRLQATRFDRSSDTWWNTSVRSPLLTTCHTDVRSVRNMYPLWVVISHSEAVGCCIGVWRWIANAVNHGAARAKALVLWCALAWYDAICTCDSLWFESLLPVDSFWFLWVNGYTLCHARKGDTIL